MSISEQSSATPSPGVNLGWALATLLRTYQKQVETVLEGLPGGARAFMILALVERETCHSQAAIAERLGLDKTNLTYLLDGLEKAGLVIRITDPEDRRSRHINLTPQGAKALQGLAAAVAEVENEVLSRLGGEDASMFQALLNRAAGIEAGSPADPAHNTEICKAALGSTEAC
jgi:MarR family transcriptional regulator for hemolysin